MKKRIITLNILLLLVLPTWAQTMESDTIGHYHSGQISASWDRITRHKLVQDKTLYLQEKYANGNQACEYFRYSDSTFYYMEYYELPDTSDRYRWSFWGIKREGMVVISNQHSTDTIVTFNPETYEEHEFFDTLLLPVGKWQFYYPNGTNRAIGSYKHYLKEGEWLYYDAFQQPDSTIQYNKGVAENIVYNNVTGHKSLEATTCALQQFWLIHDRSAFGGLATNPEFKDYRFLYPTPGISGVGDIYQFRPGNELRFNQTKVVSTEHKKVDEGLSIIQKYDITQNLEGTWKLLNYHQLEIILDNQKVVYEIEYLCDGFMRWKIIP
ncbi:MAG: hypothetical protein JNN28_18040 [Saprospiraceae bacterium]|nr:hypothetical protein [Saprospiraceae bacterium]